MAYKNKFSSFITIILVILFPYRSLAEELRVGVAGAPPFVIKEKEKIQGISVDLWEAIAKSKGWDYAHLCETYEKAVAIAREEHVPVLVHVQEVNQPQGHSTSGSHERYKDEARMLWEKEFDCIQKFKIQIYMISKSMQVITNQFFLKI